MPGAVRRVSSPRAWPYDAASRPLAWHCTSCGEILPNALVTGSVQATPSGETPAQFLPLPVLREGEHVCEKNHAVRIGNLVLLMGRWLYSSTSRRYSRATLRC